MIRVLFVLFSLCIAPIAHAEEGGIFLFGADIYSAGNDVEVDDGPVADAFLMGEKIQFNASATGSVHVMGRTVSLNAPIGQNLYALGMEVSVGGPVSGNASLTGYDVHVREAVTGNLRASASKLVIEGTIGGTVLAAAEKITLLGLVAGDARIAASDIEFGPDARVEGTLTIYHNNPDAVEIPSYVASADQIRREIAEAWDYDTKTIRSRGWSAAISGFLGSVFVTALVTVVFAAIAPKQLAALRRRALDRPFRSGWIGFLALSALSGSSILLAMTLVGLLVSPAAILLAVLLGLLGYSIGAYIFGVRLRVAFGKEMPETLGERSITALGGALAAAVVALVPFLGWLFTLALVLLGAGAITNRLFRPGFYVDESRYG